MSGKFFDAIKTLFPRSRAFELFADNSKRRLVKGFSELPENIRTELELVYFDLFPDTTRFPERWEEVFALFFTDAELPKRRNIIDAMWKMISGHQGLEFLQTMLHSIDKGLRVVENIPVSNPRHSGITLIAVCGHPKMKCGNRKAVCGYREGHEDFIPSIIKNDVTTEYNIPEDSRYWENCFFICASVRRSPRRNILYVEPYKLSAVWRNFIEFLILKVKPAHTTAIVFIDWQEGETI